MKRLVLRNKAKIKKAKGDKFYQELISSLKAYSAKKNMEIIKDTSNPHLDLIEVPNCSNKEQSFLFALIDGGLYDCQRIAFFKTEECKKLKI